MAASVRSTSFLSGYAGRTNSSFTAPAGIVDGDLLVLVFMEGGSTNPNPTPTPPPGFTALQAPIAQTLGNTLTVWWWYKVASGESGNYTITHASASTDGGLYCIAGAAVAAPAMTAATGTGGTSTAPGLTTTADGSVVIFYDRPWATFTGAASPPPGTTPPFATRRDAGIIYFADGVLSPAGATGDKTQTNTNTGAYPWTAGLIAVASSDGAPPPPPPATSTVARTFAFATAAEGFVATPGTNVTCTYDPATGNPAGALKSALATKNSNRASYWEWSGTWQDLGVPAGAKVTAARLDSAAVRCTQYTSATSAKSGPYELRDSAGTTVLATLWAGRTATAVDAAWVAVAAQADQAVPAAQQPASSALRLRLNNTLVLPNTTGAATTVYDDQVALVITYIPYVAPAAQPALLLTQF